MSTRVRVRVCASASMGHLRLAGWRRRRAGGGLREPAERVLDTLPSLRARVEHVESPGDESGSFRRADDPLILQVDLVQRDDRWDIARGAPRVVTEVEKLLDR